MYKPLPEYLTIKESSIEGLGLFTTTEIPNNFRIGITHIKDNRFENGYSRTPLGGFFNHSETPNCKVVYEGDFIYLETISDLKENEEITAFYSFYNPTKTNIVDMFVGPSHNLVWMNHFNEIMEDVYKVYANSHNKFVDGFIHTIPMVHSKESFIETIKTDDEFAEKWGVKISERELSLEERFNLRYFGGKFSVFQENYPNTHKRNDPNGLLDAFNIPTKIITLEYKEEKVSYYE